MKSIISDEKECWLCKTTLNLHLHHIYQGTANRKKSDEYGCYVYLCGKHHNLSNQGVHFDKKFDLRLKQECQKEFEKLYGHEKFMEVFKRNWL